MAMVTAALPTWRKFLAEPLRSTSAAQLTVRVQKRLFQRTESMRVTQGFGEANAFRRTDLDWVRIGAFAILIFYHVAVFQPTKSLGASVSFDPVRSKGRHARYTRSSVAAT
jgi:hypothetical protein